jgi:hypothetical protein
MFPQIPQSLQAPHLENLIPYGDFSKNPWQEGTSFAGVTTNQWAADLLRFQASSHGTYTIDQFADHPKRDSNGSCYRVLTTTGDDSVGASSYAWFKTIIEGYNAVDLLFGNADSEYLTIAFEVKSSLAGTYCIAIRNHDLDRTYVAEYVINSANTWETKTITLKADESGTWKFDTDVGFEIVFVLAAGTDWHTSADTWAAANDVATSNQVNFSAVTGGLHDFRLTDLRCYPGVVDLGAHYPDVGEVLRYCRRYYTRLTFDNGDPITIGQDYSASGTIGNVALPVTMRTTNPTPIHSAASTFKHIGATGTPLAAFTTTGTWFASEAAVRLNLTGGSGGTAGNASEIQAASAGCYIGADARW